MLVGRMCVALCVDLAILEYLLGPVRGLLRVCKCVIAHPFIQGRADHGRLSAGGWQSTHEIPSSRGSYGSFNEVSDGNKVNSQLESRNR